MARMWFASLCGLLLAVVPSQAQPVNPDRLLQGWYQQFLNRDPDPQGMRTFIGEFRRGAAPQDVLAHILGSEEYFLKAGTSPEGFVQTLFEDLLNREPTAREMNYWVRQAYQGSREDVAYAVLQMYPEATRRALPGLVPRRSFDR